MNEAHALLLQTRVTQLECVIFKTIKRSRKPKERLATALSAFDTEEHSDGKRREGAAVLGKPVLEFLQKKYELLLGPAS